MISIKTKRLICVCLAVILIVTVLSLLPSNVYITENTVYNSSDGLWQYKFVDGNSVGIEITSGVKQVSAYKGAEASVGIPAEIDGYRVVGIGRYAFYGNSSLGCVVLPDTVTLIDDFAFAVCKSLKSVKFSVSLAEIGECAFMGCVELGSLELPESLKTIASRAFYDCKALESINIPDSVMTVGTNALENTKILENSKGTLRINNCLIKVDTQTDGLFEIEQGTITIAGGAFSGCGKITEISFPDTLKSIGNSAFCDCVMLESAEIPDGVEEIGEFVFDGCTSLKTISVGSGTSVIGDGISHDCVSLEAISVSPENSSYTSVEGVLMNKQKTDLICYPAQKPDESYTVERGVSYINRYAFSNCAFLKEVIFENRAENIPEHCFENCISLESVILPSTLESIDNYAFYKCQSLNRLELPEGLREIEIRAFSQCASLESLSLPKSLATVGTEAFSGCSSLKNLTIADCDVHFRSGVFSYCTALEEVVLPDGISGVNSYMFAGCSALKSVKLGSSVRMIGDCAFEKCTQLESVTIPNNVFSIEKHAFAGCSSLKEINFEYGIKNIKSYAFSGCASLESVVLPDSLETVGSMAFSGCSGLKGITVSEKVSLIENQAFDSGITVYGYEGSYAHDYCTRKNMSFVSLGFACPDFSDVKYDSWYYESVRYCAHKGFVKGFGDGTFGADAQLQRQDFVMILAKISGADLGEYENIYCGLTDVEVEKYYTSAVKWAVANGIASGYGDGLFGVKNSVTREQAVAMLYRFVGSPEVEDYETVLEQFEDTDIIGDYALDAFKWAVGNGYISGLDENTLGPKEPASRAVAATIIMRIDKNGEFDR